MASRTKWNVSARHAAKKQIREFRATVDSVNCCAVVFYQNGQRGFQGGKHMSMPTPRDEGTGYELRRPAIKDDLVLVGRGTPMGELLRRYWHPVGLTKDACDVPRRLQALGEDLVLFRDKGGRAGLL